MGAPDYGMPIFFIVIQPIMIGTYCKLCLVTAVAMLIMIPLTLDEVVAMGQYMLRSVRSFWRTFFHGGPEPTGSADDKDAGRPHRIFRAGSVRPGERLAASREKNWQASVGIVSTNLWPHPGQTTFD